MISLNDRRRTRPISQVEVENKILELVEKMEEATEDYAHLMEKASDAESHYKAEHAKAYLRAQGAVKEREATADVACEDLLFQFKTAEALAKSRHQSLLTIRTALDGLRTIAANVRAQT